MYDLLFSADMHLNHEKIIKYCKRPFTDVNQMNTTIINNCNQISSSETTLYHIGDYCLYSQAIFFESFFNCKIVHIKGNHDKFRSISTALIKLGRLTCMLTHYPPYSVLEIPEDVDLVLTAHVHNYYLYKIIDYPQEYKRKIPLINVGVDVWDFKPVTIKQIKELYTKIMKENS